jgi:hypothetical protein
MWSWHLFWGIQFGFEFYEDTKVDDSKNTHHYNFFIIDLGCVRIQHQEKNGVNL